MNRRRVLAALGATAGSLAGCVADGADDPDADGRTPTPPATPRGTPPVNSGGLGEFDPASTYEQVDVGSRERVDDRFGPHDVRVWNAVDIERTLHLRVVDRQAEATTYRAAHEVPADAAVDLTLLEPAPYLLQVWAAGGRPRTVLRVPCSVFDCNASATSVAVHGDRTESSVVSTLAGCPAPDC